MVILDKVEENREETSFLARRYLLEQKPGHSPKAIVIEKHRTWEALLDHVLKKTTWKCSTKSWSSLCAGDTQAKVEGPNISHSEGGRSSSKRWKTGNESCPGRNPRRPPTAGLGPLRRAPRCPERKAAFSDWHTIPERTRTPPSASNGPSRPFAEVQRDWNNTFQDSLMWKGSRNEKGVSALPSTLLMEPGQEAALLCPPQQEGREGAPRTEAELRTHCQRALPRLAVTGATGMAQAGQGEDHQHWRGGYNTRPLTRLNLSDFSLTRGPWSWGWGEGWETLAEN